MNIYAIGRNYAEHIAELNNERPDEPVVFIKPDSSILLNNDPFYYPDFSNDIHYEVELVLQICKRGKGIQPEFAHDYYDKIGLGIDFTARDLQNKAKEKRLPWTIAKGFHGAAPISKFIPVKDFSDLENINFRLAVNNTTVQKGNSQLMLFGFEMIISYLSRYFTLKKGDLIFTGTPKGVGAIAIGDKLTGYIENHRLLNFEIK